MVIMYHCNYKCCQDKEAINKLKLSFEWFLGRNELGIPLYDKDTGGCNDGLEEQFINRNQGAESTLAYLMSRLIAEAYY